MNLFVTNKNPLKSAESLDDKRVNKIALEAAHMLSIGVSFALDSHCFKRTKTGKLYKSMTNDKSPELMKPHPLYNHHPVSKWVRKSRQNYIWTFEYLESLLYLYETNYNKKHAISNRLKYFKKYITKFPNSKEFDFNNSTSSKVGSFKKITDTTLAYRIYLSAKWDTDVINPTWRNRTYPAWYDDYSYIWPLYADEFPDNIEYRRSNYVF